MSAFPAYEGGEGGIVVRCVQGVMVRWYVK